MKTNYYAADLETPEMKKIIKECDKENINWLKEINSELLKVIREEGNDTYTIEKEGKIKMENQDILSKGVGENEAPKGIVEPKPVVIMGMTIKDKKSDGTAMKTPMVQFMAKHPDKEEPILMSKIKYLEGNKAVVKGFWVQTDDDGNFFKGSTIDLFLQKLNCKTLKDTEGEVVETVTESDASSYLCFKLY